jgi:hypothetical protein
MSQTSIQERRERRIVFKSLADLDLSEDGADLVTHSVADLDLSEDGADLVTHSVNDLDLSDDGAGLVTHPTDTDGDDNNDIDPENREGYDDTEDMGELGSRFLEDLGGLFNSTFSFQDALKRYLYFACFLNPPSL